MNYENFYESQIDLIRDLTLQSMIDTCTIQRQGVSSVDSRGISTKNAPTIISYNGSTEIPCRIEVARHFMNDRDVYQVVVTDTYTLYLPHDIDVQETDNIIWNGYAYDIRKLVLAGNMGTYTEVMLVHTDKNQ